MAQEMKIKVVAVEAGKGTTKTGKDYKFIEVTYKNLSFDGKTESKKIMPFGSKEVMATLEGSSAGDVFTILREKDNDGYWQWVGIAEGDVTIEKTGNAAPSKATTDKPANPAKSTFETPEERAAKQIYIVRQSSISSAIDTLKTDKKTPSVEEVIAVAKQYEAYVFGNEPKAAEATKLPELPQDDDIPY